jgi:hypothetical protein
MKRNLVWHPAKPTLKPKCMKRPVPLHATFHSFARMETMIARMKSHEWRSILGSLSGLEPEMCFSHSN